MFTILQFKDTHTQSEAVCPCAGSSAVDVLRGVMMKTSTSSATSRTQNWFRGSRSLALVLRCSCSNSLRIPRRCASTSRQGQSQTYTSITAPHGSWSQRTQFRARLQHSVANYRFYSRLLCAVRLFQTAMAPRTGMLRFCGFGRPDGRTSSDSGTSACFLTRWFISSKWMQVFAVRALLATHPANLAARHWPGGETWRCAHLPGALAQPVL